MATNNETSDNDGDSSGTPETVNFAPLKDPQSWPSVNIAQQYLIQCKSPASHMGISKYVKCYDKVLSCIGRRYSSKSDEFCYVLKHCILGNGECSPGKAARLVKKFSKDPIRNRIETAQWFFMSSQLYVVHLRKLYAHLNKKNEFVEKLKKEAQEFNLKMLAKQNSLKESNAGGSAASEDVEKSSVNEKPPAKVDRKKHSSGKSKRRKEDDPEWTPEEGRGDTKRRSRRGKHSRNRRSRSKTKSKSKSKSSSVHHDGGKKIRSRTGRRGSKQKNRGKCFFMYFCLCIVHLKCLSLF